MIEEDGKRLPKGRKVKLFNGYFSKHLVGMCNLKVDISKVSMIVELYKVSQIQTAIMLS